jgi:hypothetical protein
LYKTRNKIGWHAFKCSAVKPSKLAAFPLFSSKIAFSMKSTDNRYFDGNTLFTKLPISERNFDLKLSFFSELFTVHVLAKNEANLFAMSTWVLEPSTVLGIFDVFFF